ncbi:MAG: C-type lectin domain-containing protein, partial [Myxococcales bacterium]|nr:C-type lectin domain-containing protein [Myxococcales bacterium]
GRFAYWGSGAPGSQRCAIIDPANRGQWFDANCAESHGYICEFPAPVTPVGFTPPPGTPAAPAPSTGACVPEFSLDAGGLPDSATELLNELDAARQDVFIGAAAPPPPDGSVCQSDLDGDVPAQGIGLNPSSGAGCAFTNVVTTSDCLQDSDCLTFGSHFVCRQIKDDGTCTPNGSAGVPVNGTTCRGHSRCGVLNCPTLTTTCNQIEVCNPGTTFDAGPDPGSNLDAEPFNPAALFEGGLPDAAPAGAYIDPPDGSGPDHTWCHMVPQDPVPAANQPAKNKGGSSGNNTKIKFSFTPNLIFNVDAKPLALMESGFNMHAQASMVASVQLNNFLDQSYQADIINATAGLQAHRCSVSDDETQFTVLGLDFLSLDGFQIPVFNTDLPSSSFHNATVQCNHALGDFLMWANRVKKAYRDAQQLLTQYHGAIAAGGRLASDLCQNIMSVTGTEDVPFFPGGLRCYDNETAEITINRFIDYLQAPGSGQLAQLLQAIRKLGDVTNSLRNALSTKLLQIDVKPADKEESQTIADVQFAIGPVPMVLEIDLFARYGIDGQLLTELNFPFNPLSQPGAQAGQPGQLDNKLADIQVAVSPHASAGLEMFLGAGASLGPFDATLGIEGSVTLAEVHAPIFGGAGVTMDVTQDFRPIPIDIAPPVSDIGPLLGTSINSAFQFGIPTAAKLGVYYKFGAGVDLDHVLSGELDAKLEISFFFFSKTWRKLIVKYNGWSFHYDFVSQAALPLGSIGSSGKQTVPNSEKEGQKAQTN